MNAIKHSEFDANSEEWSIYSEQACANEPCPLEIVFQNWGQSQGWISTWNLYWVEIFFPTYNETRLLPPKGS